MDDVEEEDTPEEGGGGGGSTQGAELSMKSFCWVSLMCAIPCCCC